MRSRSTLEQAALALGAAVEGVWCGALAAVLAGSSWVLLSVFAAATVAVAAATSVRWAGAAPDRERTGRVAIAALIVGAVVLLLGAGRAWTHEYLFWQAVRDVAFVCGLVFLGARLGGEDVAPEEAVRRAGRGFALLCTVLVCAAVAGVTPGWAAAAVVAALVSGGLLIAVVRYRALSDLVAATDRLPSWPWLLAVTGVILSAVAVAALLGQLFDIHLLRWVLDLLGAVLSAVFGIIAYAIGWTGAGLLRALQWAIGLLHLRAPHLELKPPPTLSVRVVVPPYQPAAPGSSATRLVVTVAGALVAVTGSLALVVLALRRLRRRSVPEAAITEEREALGSLSEAAGAVVGGLGRRLRRRLSRLGRREALSPAELVRLRYARLEKRLAAGGHARPPGMTVRAFLASCAAPMEAPVAAGDLAGLYELARYSAQAVAADQAERFEELAQGFAV